MAGEKKVQKRTLESREKLLNAAYQLFAEKGYYNTNTKEIARSAGISVGNFYNYYEDKAGIYAELVRQYTDTSRENLKILLDELLKKMDRIKNLEDVIDAVDDYANQQLGRAEVSGILFKDAYLIQRDHIVLDQIMKESELKLIAVLEEFLMKCPNIQRRASYPVMARMLFVMGDTISIDVMRTRDRDFFEEYRREMSTVLAEYVFGAGWKKD